MTLLVLLCTFLGTPDPSAAGESERLAGLLRGLVLANLPAPLTRSDRGWGRQRDVVVGVKWRGLRAEAQRAPRDDGHWQRLRVEASDPARTLSVGVRNLRSPEPGRSTFEAMAGVDVRAVYEQQVWRAGVRLFSGETRVRARAAVRLACEVSNRLDRAPGAVLPAVVLRVRVTDAEVFYTDVVCEHTAGVGGEAAKTLGDAAITFLRAVKPDAERDLLAKANAAVVKAADTKEVRVELDQLLSGRPPAVTRSRGR